MNILDKQSYIQHLFDPTDGSHITGPLSNLMPSEKELELIYNDGSTVKVKIDSSNFSATENPLNGKVDVYIKLTLERTEEKKYETNCL